MDDTVERQLAAEAERRALLTQAMHQHEDRLAAEIRRYRSEVEHINNVCDLRTHNPSVPT